LILVLDRMEGKKINVKSVGQECPTHTGLSHAQVFGRFQRRAAFAADDSSTISADQRISDLDGALGAIEQIRFRGVFGGHQE
jgi:hypothetical protein